MVEIGEGPSAKLVSSCTYPAEEGLKVRTASARVVRARKMILELLLASCPQSKVIQDLASAHGVRQQRFRQEHEDCILCGRCVRMCEEQMMAKAIGFRGRGAEPEHRHAVRRAKSEVCRLCGGCMYVCPACQLRCTYTEPDKAICGGCANLSPPCLEKEQFDDMMCYMDPASPVKSRKQSEEPEGGTLRCHLSRVNSSAATLTKNRTEGSVTPSLGHVRHLRGRLHRHVRDRQVGLPRPRGDLSAAVRRHHHRRRKDATRSTTRTSTSWARASAPTASRPTATRRSSPP